MTDDDFWRKVDRLEEFVESFITAGIVDESLRRDATDHALGFAVRAGHLAYPEYRKELSYSAWSNAERKTIVEDYARFARENRTKAARGAKLRSLGVSRCQIHFWGVRFAPGLLASVNMHCRDDIVEWLRDHPWSTASQIRDRMGLVPSTCHVALIALTRSGRLVRRPASPGQKAHYEYAAASAVTEREAKTIATGRAYARARPPERNRGRRA